MPALALQIVAVHHALATVWFSRNVRTGRQLVDHVVLPMVRCAMIAMLRRPCRHGSDSAPGARLNRRARSRSAVHRRHAEQRPCGPTHAPVARCRAAGDPATMLESRQARGPGPPAAASAERHPIRQQPFTPLPKDSCSNCSSPIGPRRCGTSRPVRPKRARCAPQPAPPRYPGERAQYRPCRTPSMRA